MNALRVCLFGTVTAEIDGVSLLDGCGQRERELLILLVLDSGKAIDRIHLAETMWPDAELQVALYNLRRHLSRLRSALAGEGDRLQTVKPRSLRLDLADAWVDVAIFDDMISSKDPAMVEQAVAVYRGPLAEGCHAEWIHSERHRREVAYCDGLLGLLNQTVVSEEWNTVVRLSRLLIVSDPLRETAHRALMLALANTGSLPAANQVYRDLRLRLREAINQEPDPETKALFEQIRYNGRLQEDKRLPDHSPTRPDSETFPTAGRPRLPHLLTSIVGRESELAELRQLLTTTRILTLTGTGGVGKTRLSLELGATVQSGFKDGACFVDLSAIVDPANVATEILRSIGCDHNSSNPATSICRYLADRSMLVVLDSCEHLIRACAALVNQIAVECPSVRILATSRQPLGVPGEVSWKTPSLEFPPDDLIATMGAKDMSDALDYVSVRLFVDRARQYQPSFRLQERDLADIARICRRLDGIPLAIELAANRLKALTVSQIAARLDDRFHLLTGGNRATPPRQQTMMALLDWSYDLLDVDERNLFQRMSVFKGSWTLDALNGICGEKCDEWDTIDGLSSLVDKSLVIAETTYDGEMRYRLLESVREYAWHKLSQESQPDAAQSAHLFWYMGYAEATSEFLSSDAAPIWLDRLDRDRDNFRAALQFALDCAVAAQDGALETALRLTYGLWRYWYMRSYVIEGSRNLNALLRLPCDAALIRWRARNLNVQAAFATRLLDLSTAHQALEECIHIYRTLGDELATASARSTLASVLTQEGKFAESLAENEKAFPILLAAGDKLRAYSNLVGAALTERTMGRYAEAEAHLRQCVDTFREIGYGLGEATAWNVLAEILMDQGDLAGAEPMWHQALSLRQALGDREGVGFALSGIARIAYFQGNWSRAEQLHRECLALRKELHMATSISDSHCDLARVYLSQNRLGEARDALNMCVDDTQGLPDHSGQVLVIRTIFEYCCRTSEWEKAANIAGFLVTNSHMDATPRPPSYRAQEAQWVEKVRSELELKQFADLFEEGCKSSQSDVIGWFVRGIR